MSPLDKHDEVRHGCHHENDEDRGQDAHGTGAHQLQQTTDGARQTCGDTSKDEDRDAVAQTTFRDLFTEPHQEHGAGRQADHRREAEAEARAQNQTCGAFQSHGNSQGLKNRQAQCAVAGVLGDLATTRFTFLFQLLECRDHVGHELHDDRCRDVRHDPQCEHREARERPTREHVEQIENAALLAIEQLLQLRWIDARHGDMSPDPVNDQREQQKNQTAAKIAEFSGFCNLSCASSHGCLLSDH